jgi:hypothetical protein
MLGGQAIFREQHPHPAGPSQPGGQLAVAAKRPELETSAVQEEEYMLASPLAWAACLRPRCERLCPGSQTGGELGHDVRR